MPNIHLLTTRPLSAEGVSAIDSTARMREPANQAADFTSLLHALAPGGTDAGDCWVSTVCFVPGAVQQWLAAVLPSLPNLAVYTSTVLSSLEMSSATGAITSLTLVQRAARDGVDAWDRHFSDEVDDWYARTDSPRFAKTILTAAASVAGRTMVVIDATAFGDALVLADAPYTCVSVRVVSMEIKKLWAISTCCMCF